MDPSLALAAGPSAWAALATLITMEVVLGLDNLVFIALLSNRIDEASRAASGCRSRWCSAWRSSPRRRGRCG